MVDLPVLTGSAASEKTTTKAFPMIEVHELLSYVHDTVKLRTPVEHVRFYWDWSKRHGEGFATHSPGGPTTVPIGFYSDEARYGLQYNTDKVLAIYINLVLFRPQSVRLSRFLIFSIRSKFLISAHTIGPVLQRTAWGLHWAFLGTFPTCDLDGGPLPPAKQAKAGQPLCQDNTNFLCTEYRGDLALHKFLWSFKKRGWNAIDTCFFCEAKPKGDRMTFDEVGDRASWIPSIYQDTLEWASATLPQSDV